MTNSDTTAERYHARSGDFIRSASVLCSDIHSGWLPSACLLLGFACELLAKRRLLHSGISETVLRNKPYGHDILAMWRMTGLYSEAQEIVLKLKQKPNPKGVDAYFDWDLHFAKLASGHSQSGDYSLRYHQGDIHFADPIAVTVVLSNIWNADGAKLTNPDLQ